MKINKIIKTIITIFIAGIIIELPGSKVSAEESESNSFYSIKKTALDPWPRKINPVHMVLVFTKFKGEAPGDSLAPEWANELFNGEPGSVSHFFDTVSFGKYKVSGEYLTKRYELPQDSSYYVDNTHSYSWDVITLLNEDPDVNFTRFDNDGRDGIPGSTDDDGYVDYMILMPRSRPYDFIDRYATGVMNMGLKEFYVTGNKNILGIKTRLDKNSGSIATASSKNTAIGTIVAELSHAYGTVDLMDKIWDDPASDSAGAGYWCILGRGALGWEEKNGPMGPSAYNRMVMDSVGRNNVNLVDLYGMQQGVRIKDVGKEDGIIYRIWISDKEFFLIEYRRNRYDGCYYDAFIPQNGILIWHVYLVETNSNEYHKLCDLECPDGRYRDAGYPLGEKPDPINGGDNLDFWAHDMNYALLHEGNAGDSGDVFDGIRYTSFGSNTNPNTFSKVTKQSTGIEIFNIHPEGDEMVFDCIVPPFYNWFEEKYPFIGVAFHRFATTGISGSSKPAVQNLYLLKFGLNPKAEALVTITADSLLVESLNSLEQHEIDILVAKRLLTEDKHLRNSRIIRRNVPNEEFEAIVSNFGLHPEELGTGRRPQLVQKVSRISGNDSSPFTIDLHQNYPNPFNAQTIISYTLQSDGLAALEVYNILGQRVMLIDEGYKKAGLHTLRLDAGGLASGIYLYRLSGKTVSPSRKFILVR